MPINHKYKYDDADIQAILESRKKLIEDNTPNAFRKPVFVMAGVSNYEPDILTIVLELEKEFGNGERILLIPCCLRLGDDIKNEKAERHWVGILLEFNSANNIEKALYLNSTYLPIKERVPNVEITRQLQQSYPAQMLKFANCLYQDDATSCGSYMIENLLRHSLRAVNNQALNAEQLRSNDLESLRINRRDYYTVFYCKQSGKKVSDLQISKNPIIQQYIEQIQNNVESLTEISLSGMGLKDDDLIPLLSAFLENPDAADRITKLDVSNNKLMNIDLSMFYNLADLSVANNKLIELDLSNSIKLTRLLANDNQIESISFHVKNSITHLGISNNNIKSMSADNLRAVIAEIYVDRAHNLLNTELQFKINATESQDLNASALAEIQRISAAEHKFIPNKQYFKQLLFSDGSQCLVGYVNGHLRIKSEDIVDVTVKNAALLNSIDVVTNGKMVFEGSNAVEILQSNVAAFEQAENTFLKILGDDKIITIGKSENSEENTYTLSSSVKSNLVSAGTKINSICVLKDFNVFSDKIKLNEGAIITGANCCFANSKREAVKRAKLDIVEEQVAAIKDKEPAANEDDKPLEDGSLNNTEANSNTEPMSIDVHGKCIVDVLSIRAEKLNVSPTGVLNGVSKTDISASEDFWTTGRIEGKRIQLSAAYLMIMNLAYIFASLDINIDAPIGTFIIAGATLRAPKIFATTGCYVNLGGVVCAYEFSKNTLYPLDLGLNLAWAPEKKSDLINPSKLLALAVRVASNVTKTIQPMLSTASVVGDMGYALYCLESKNPITNLKNAGTYMAENGSYVFKTTTSAAQEFYNSKERMNLCKKNITKKWNAMNIKDFFRLMLATKGYVIAGKAILSKVGGAAAAANQLKKGAKALYIDGFKSLSETKAAVSAEVSAKYAELKEAAPDRNTAMQAGKDFVMAKAAEVAGDAVKPIVNAKNFISDPGTMSEKISAKASSIASAVTLTNLKKTLVDDQVEKIYKIQQDISNVYYENSFQDAVAAETQIDTTTEPEIATNPEPIKTESIPSPPSELGAEPVKPEETKITESNPVATKKKTYLYKDIFSDVLSSLGPSVRGSSLFGINSGITISGSVTEEALGHFHSGATYAARCDIYAHTFYNAGKYSGNQHNVFAQNYYESGSVDSDHRTLDVNNFTVNKDAAFDAHKGVIANIGNLDMHGKQKISGGKVIVENDNIVHETGQQTVESGLLHVKGDNINKGAQDINGGTTFIEGDNIGDQGGVQKQTGGEVLISGNNRLKAGAEQNLRNGAFAIMGGSYVEKGAKQNLLGMKSFYASSEQINGERHAKDCDALYVGESTVAEGAKYGMEDSTQNGKKIKFEKKSNADLKDSTLAHYDQIESDGSVKADNAFLHAKDIKITDEMSYTNDLILSGEKIDLTDTSSIKHTSDESACLIKAKDAIMPGGQQHANVEYIIDNAPSKEMEDLVDGKGMHSNKIVTKSIKGTTKSTQPIEVHVDKNGTPGHRPRGNAVQTFLLTGGTVTNCVYKKAGKAPRKKETDGRLGVINGREGYAYHGIKYGNDERKHGLSKIFNSEKVFKRFTEIAAVTAALFAKTNPMISIGATGVVAASQLQLKKIRDKKNDAAKNQALVELNKANLQVINEIDEKIQNLLLDNYLANIKGKDRDPNVIKSILTGNFDGAMHPSYLSDSEYAKKYAEIMSVRLAMADEAHNNLKHYNEQIEQNYQDNRRQIRNAHNIPTGINVSANAGPTGVDLNVGAQIEFQGKRYVASKQIANIETTRIKIDTGARIRREQEEELARRARNASNRTALPQGYTGQRPIEIQMAETRLENSRTEAIESWRPRVEFRALEDGIGEEEKVSEPLVNPARRVLFDQETDFYEGRRLSSHDQEVFRANLGAVLRQMESQTFGRVRLIKNAILNAYERDRQLRERIAHQHGRQLDPTSMAAAAPSIMRGGLALVPDGPVDAALVLATKPLTFLGKKAFCGVMRAGAKKANGAANAALAEKLAKDLEVMTLKSIFTKDGKLTKSAINEAEIIIKGDRFNPKSKIFQELSKRGNINDWGKYRTQKFYTSNLSANISRSKRNVSADVHFYKNKITEEIFYDLDYKVKLDCYGNPSIKVQDFLNSLDHRWRPSP